MSTRSPSPLPDRASRAQGGFTLLELILVLVVIAIVSGIAIPSHFNRAEVTLENAAILLANDLRRAQNRAAYLGAPVEISFDSRVHGYRIWQGARDEHEEDGLDAEEEQTSYARIYTRDAVFEGVTVENALFGDKQSLRYESSGRAEKAGQVFLRYGGDLRIVQVEAPTGKLTIVGTSTGWSDRGF